MRGGLYEGGYTWSKTSVRERWTYLRGAYTRGGGTYRRRTTVCSIRRATLGCHCRGEPNTFYRFFVSIQWTEFRSARQWHNV